MNPHTDIKATNTDQCTGEFNDAFQQIHDLDSNQHKESLKSDHFTNLMSFDPICSQSPKTHNLQWKTSESRYGFVSANKEEPMSNWTARFLFSEMTRIHEEYQSNMNEKMTELQQFSKLQQQHQEQKYENYVHNCIENVKNQIWKDVHLMIYEMNQRIESIDQRIEVTKSIQETNEELIRMKLAEKQDLEERNLGKYKELKNHLEHVQNHTLSLHKSHKTLTQDIDQIQSAMSTLRSQIKSQNHQKIEALAHSVNTLKRFTKDQFNSTNKFGQAEKANIFDKIDKIEQTNDHIHREHEKKLLNFSKSIQEVQEDRITQKKIFFDIQQTMTQITLQYKSNTTALRTLTEEMLLLKRQVLKSSTIHHYYKPSNHQCDAEDEDLLRAMYLAIQPKERLNRGMFPMEEYIVHPSSTSCAPT